MSNTIEHSIHLYVIAHVVSLRLALPRKQQRLEKKKVGTVTDLILFMTYQDNQDEEIILGSQEAPINYETLSTKGCHGKM